MCRFPMALLPNSIHALAEAKVSARRISEYLCLPELQPYIQDGQTRGRVELNNCTFRLVMLCIDDDTRLSNMMTLEKCCGL